MFNWDNELEERTKDEIRDFGYERYSSGMWHSCLLYLGVMRICLLGDFTVGVPLAIVGFVVMLIHLMLDGVKKVTKKEKQAMWGLFAIAIMAIIFMIIDIFVIANREAAAKKADSVIEIQEKQ